MRLHHGSGGDVDGGCRSCCREPDAPCECRLAGDESEGGERCETAPGSPGRWDDFVRSRRRNDLDHREHERC